MRARSKGYNEGCNKATECMHQSVNAFGWVRRWVGTGLAGTRVLAGTRASDEEHLVGPGQHPMTWGVATMHHPSWMVSKPLAHREVHPTSPCTCPALP